MTKKSRAGQRQPVTTPTIPGWQRQTRLGAGGNGEVWLYGDGANNAIAVKILGKMEPKRYRRFKAEAGTLTQLGTVGGVVPILNRYLPNKLTPVDPPWYSMPVATPMPTSIPPIQVVQNIAEVAKTLAHLHALGVSHRDIKPDNLLWFNGKPCISDFGLAKWTQSNENLTGATEPVGPRWTIAPEMRRAAATADGRQADVYSLAKTLWMLLSGKRDSFDGQYRRDVVELDIAPHMQKHAYLRPLHALLELATEHDAAARPTMEEFCRGLVDWLAAESDFRLRIEREWRYLHNWLFRQFAPTSATWGTIATALPVLRELVLTKTLTHVFFPDSGGLDLTGIHTGRPDGLVELEMGTGTPVLVAFQSVTLVHFETLPEWSYFWLDLNELQPSGVYPNRSAAAIAEFPYETVLELPDYSLASPDTIEGGYYENQAGIQLALPGGSRVVTRQFCGPLVIFAKTAPYDRDPSTYDGRHAELGRERFRAYIAEHVAHIAKGAPVPPTICGRRAVAPTR